MDDRPAPHRLFVSVHVFKPFLSLMIAFSAITGYVNHTGRLDRFAAVIGLLVFALASGAGALNNAQDRERDRFFSRTRNRGIPARVLSVNQARIAAVTLILIGTAGLLVFIRPTWAALLGPLAVLLYNGLYTPLKARTLFALLPGVVCGMIPPLIGWAAAGGRPITLQIGLLMALVGVWQPPHFWMILMVNSDEYRQAPLPSMVKAFSENQLKRIVFSWILAYALIGVLLPIGGLVTRPWLQIALVAYLLVFIVALGFHLVQPDSRAGSRRAMAHVNMSVGWIMLMVVIDRLTSVAP